MGCGVKVGPSSKRLISVNAVKGTIKVSILAILLGMIAPQPVQSLIKLSPFFSPSEKYQQWYHETTWLQDARAQKRAGWRMKRRDSEANPWQRQRRSAIPILKRNSK